MKMADVHGIKARSYFLAEKSEAENENQTLDQLDPKTGGQSRWHVIRAVGAGSELR